MGESDPVYRRLDRRERRLMRRLQVVVPIVLVIAAALLSMGVIKVMEVPKPKKAWIAKPPPAPVQRPEKQLFVPKTQAELDSLLDVSLLDEAGADGGATGPLPEVDAGPPLQLAPIPEPGSFLLLAVGVAALAWLRGYSTIAISSTSKVRAAPGGIAGGAPRSP